MNVQKNDRREIFGWKMYDWANSAFSTTVAGALLAPYVTSLAQAAVGKDGIALDLGLLGTVGAKGFFGYCISFSVAIQALMLPVVGALADYSRFKRGLMAAFCYVGVAATCALFFVTAKLFLLGGVLFIIANACFGASVVLYNSYLPELVSTDETDKVSSSGFAYGYIGGGVLLALNFGLLLSANALGIGAGMAVRISLCSAGVWWGAFALMTFTRLRAVSEVRAMPAGQTIFTVGFTKLGATFRELWRLPYTLKYLIGYLFFNDGIQTVIAMASLFLSQELFTEAQREAGTANTFVLQIFLLVQFVAFGGAFLFARIAASIGTKRALLLSLVLWCGIVVYAYGFMHSTGGAWAMGASLAIVLGGSQALSRSLFARMIPAGYDASFFGLYEVSERGTSWIGPALFAFIVDKTGSYREAILSLIVLFVVGTVILALTDTDRAIREAQALR